jgi:hypothetical protein
MNKRFSLALVLIGLGAAVLAAGCQSHSQPTLEPTPTANVVIEIVTATSQPTIEATAVNEPTITPLATFTPLGTLAPTETPVTPSPTRKVATVAPSTPKPVRTNTLVVAASPTAAPSINKYPAPTALSPGPGDSNHDGADIQFYFASVGPLGSNECYLIHAQMTNPTAPSGGVGYNEYLDSDHCGDQSRVGAQLKYVLYRPTFHNAPNYGTMETQANVPPVDLLKLTWYVRVVRIPGSDGIHHDVTFISPPSATLESDFLP